jgi:hypothetical protein
MSYALTGKMYEVRFGSHLVNQSYTWWWLLKVGPDGEYPPTPIDEPFEKIELIAKSWL